MKKIVDTINQLPKWYGIGVIIIYSILCAELFSIINNIVLSSNDFTNNNIFVVLSRISYGITVLSQIIVWIIAAFLFHLMALLFNGKSQFKRFLFISSYPYIIPATVILIGIFLLDNVRISETKEIVNFLANNSSFKLVINLINYSFIIYYIFVSILIHYIYKIKYVYAILSVVIPIASIWIMAQLFGWVLY